MIAETLEALNEARQSSGASENEVLFGGIEGELEKLAAMDAASPQNGEGQGGSSQEAFEKQQMHQEQLTNLQLHSNNK